LPRAAFRNPCGGHFDARFEQRDQIVAFHGRTRRPSSRRAETRSAVTWRSV
jgi:hypothetical protein